MEGLTFSIIIPLYNRPQEIQELLQSLTIQSLKTFQVIVVEDGSTIRSEDIINAFKQQLDIAYYYKENSGPGDSRNYGMQRATGNYFIILDSDCILPVDYVKNVHNALSSNFVDCYGGVDSAMESFSDTQKAINYAMTSPLTTGGVRGASERLTRFQPRSFNMGISKTAFEATGGFGTIHPGEDPDLSMRLWDLGFTTMLISDVTVYHKRRINWNNFLVQVTKFGMVRPILNKWHPNYTKLAFFFPTVFVIGFVFAMVCSILGAPLLFQFYLIYLLVCFIDSWAKNKSLSIGLQSVWAVLLQFFGYGWGFLNSFWKVQCLKQQPEHAFPELFFKKNKNN